MMGTWMDGWVDDESVLSPFNDIKFSLMLFFVCYSVHFNVELSSCYFLLLLLILSILFPSG